MWIKTISWMTPKPTTLICCIQETKISKQQDIIVESIIVLFVWISFRTVWQWFPLRSQTRSECLSFLARINEFVYYSFRQKNHITDQKRSKTQSWEFKNQMFSIEGNRTQNWPSARDNLTSLSQKWKHMHHLQEVVLRQEQNLTNFVHNSAKRPPHAR